MMRDGKSMSKAAKTNGEYSLPVDICHSIFESDLLKNHPVEEIMKKIIAVLLLSVAFVAPAVAANNGFYVGAQAGYGVGILGGIQIDKILAVEVDYMSYSRRSNFDKCGFTNCGSYINASSLGVFGVGKIPLRVQGISTLSAFGKLGIVRSTVSANNAGYDYSQSETALGAGLGVEYDFQNNIAARLGVDINNFYSDDLYIGVLYKF